MMVKRYVVRDMPEAVVMIRKDLGKDAVILSTKRIALKKWLGLWRTKRLEVLAAAGEDMPIQTSPPRRVPHGAKAYIAAGEAVRPSQPEQRPESMTDPDSVPATDRISASNLVLPAAPSELSQLQSQLSEVKRLLESSITDDRFNRQPILRQLAEQGVETNNLMTLLRSGFEGKAVGVETAVGGDQLLEGLRYHLSDIGNPQPIADACRIAAFVGPTGVGKTTTIAKIAALQMLSGHRKVGLLTSDTYRIAAVEQLRTYARILDIPLEVVYQAHEFDDALSRLQDRDLILIDTAGRNFRQDAHVAETKELLTKLHVDETHLVLSLTSKPRDVSEVAEKFMALPVDKFLFTKLDETATYGAALNLLYQYRKPISYITNGQSVPDDIEVASLDKLLKLILEGAA